MCVFFECVLSITYRGPLDFSSRLSVQMFLNICVSISVCWAVAGSHKSHKATLAGGGVSFGGVFRSGWGSPSASDPPLLSLDLLC